jgi:hypothetical protein
MQNASDRMRPVLLLLVSAVFLYLALFVWPASPRLFPYDQFINFDNARRMAAGQRLYRDIFQYTLPGTELLELGLIKIFGPRLAILNWTLFAAGMIDALLIFRLASSIVGPWDAVLASMLFLYFGVHPSRDLTHHTFSVLFAYAAAATLIGSRRTSRLVAAGLLLGLATAFTQTMVVVAAGIVFFVFWENRLKPTIERRVAHDLLWLLTPFFALVSLALLYVLWNGGWNHLYGDIIRFPFRRYPYGWDNNWSTMIAEMSVSKRATAQWVAATMFVPGIYLLFSLCGYLGAKRGMDKPPVRCMFVAMFGISLWATLWYAPLYIRLVEVMAPALILSIWMIDRARAQVKWRPLAWAGICTLMVIASVRSQRRSYFLYPSPAGRVAFSNTDRFAELTWLDHHIRRGQYFFSPATPMFYTLLDVRNVAPVPFIENDAYTRPEQVQAALDGIRKNRPEIIFWPFAEDDADDPGDLLYPLGEELRGDYWLVKSFPDGDMWQRKDTKPPLHLNFDSCPRRLYRLGTRRRVLVLPVGLFQIGV